MDFTASGSAPVSSPGKPSSSARQAPPQYSSPLPRKSRFRPALAAAALPALPAPPAPPAPTNLRPDLDPDDPDHAESELDPDWYEHDIGDDYEDLWADSREPPVPTPAVNKVWVKLFIYEIIA
jgi:hypothetical protein